MQQLLFDPNTFKKEILDLTNKIENQLNLMVNTWLNNGFIDLNVNK